MQKQIAKLQREAEALKRCMSYARLDGATHSPFEVHPGDAVVSCVHALDYFDPGHPTGRKLPPPKGRGNSGRALV